MQTVFILIIIVFTFCVSIGLMIYDKDNNSIDKENIINDELSAIFDDDVNDNEEII